MKEKFGMGVGMWHCQKGHELAIACLATIEYMSCACYCLFRFFVYQENTHSKINY